MNKILCGVLALGLLFASADALQCNYCTVGVFGYCLFGSTTTCNNNQTSCYTSTATFSGVSGFSGFSTQGCYSNLSTCNSSYSGTILTATYTVATTCCSANNCNPMTSGAPSVKMSLSAATGAALLASVWIKLMY